MFLFNQATAAIRDAERRGRIAGLELAREIEECESNDRNVQSMINAQIAALRAEQ
jgi:hypothetical protein